MYPPRITSLGRIRLQIRNRPSTQARIAQVVDNNLQRGARRCRHDWRRPGAPATALRLTPSTPALPSAAGDPTPAAPQPHGSAPQMQHSARCNQCATAPAATAAGQSARHLAWYAPHHFRLPLTYLSARRPHARTPGNRGSYKNRLPQSPHRGRRAPSHPHCVASRLQFCSAKLHMFLPNLAGSPHQPLTCI